MRIQHFARLLAGAASLTLASCGGGGSHVASTPTPAPTPTPTPTQAIKIFATPTVGEYASVGASISGPGGNLDTYSAPTSFGNVSSAADDQAHIRYTADGAYEVMLAGADWDRLIPYKGLEDPDPNTNNYFQPASVPMNYGYVVTGNSRDSGYDFSEIAAWGSKAESRFGYVAFGVPTPAAGVPTVGSASFDGQVAGTTDIMQPDYLYGGYYTTPVGGSVSLHFDFASGTLDGSMSLSLPDGMQPLSIGTFSFTDTVFSAGSTTYSGTFDTSTEGDNFFLGRFTGPGAEETIGAWALPFVFDMNGENIQSDGQVHQAFGAWIAKRGN